MSSGVEAASFAGVGATTLAGVAAILVLCLLFKGCYLARTVNKLSAANNAHTEALEEISNANSMHRTEVDDLERSIKESKTKESELSASNKQQSQLLDEEKKKYSQLEAKLEEKMKEAQNHLQMQKEASELYKAALTEKTALLDRENKSLRESLKNTQSELAKTLDAAENKRINEDKIEDQALDAVPGYSYIYIF
jgi:hypothetical protein